MIKDDEKLTIIEFRDVTNEIKEKIQTRVEEITRANKRQS